MINLLNESGKIVIEIPNFSGYHHQHLFYYNVAFMNRLCSDNGLKIINHYEDNKILRLVLAKQDNNFYEPVKIEFNEKHFIKRVLNSYEKFKEKVSHIRKLLNKYKDSNIVWWGAGSLSVIYLNHLLNEVMSTSITIVDGDKNKENLFIPGANLKVNYFKILENKSVDVIVIASSYVKEIENTIKEHNIKPKKIEVIL